MSKFQHHQSTCSFTPEQNLQEKKQREEIKKRMHAAEIKKKQLKKQKEAFICPYGCGRTYTNYNYAARKHLTICDLKDEIKMVAYMKAKNMLH